MGVGLGGCFLDVFFCHFKTCFLRPDANVNFIDTTDGCVPANSCKWPAELDEEGWTNEV